MSDADINNPGARLDAFIPVDASGGDWDEPGTDAGRAAVLGEVDPDTGKPRPRPDADEGIMDPLCWQFHDLNKQLPTGRADRRLSIRMVNDFEAPQEPNAPSDAPHAQPEGWTSRNRSTRVRDAAGRVALPSSSQRIVDAEDGRHALALTCPGPDLGGAEPEIVAQAGDQVAGNPWPEGVRVFDAGSGGSGSAGGVTFRSAGISVGGATFFGGAAIDAAANARDAGGSIGDMARAASAAARGLQPPPLLDAPDPGETRERPQVPEPDRNPDGGGAWGPTDQPGGYVSDGEAHGALGSVFQPRAQGGFWFRGSEGTPIGPLPIRHDAQVADGDGNVGRVVFDPTDVAGIKPGTGRTFKGVMAWDSSRANIDTQLGHETGQWRPAINVDADIPFRGGIVPPGIEWKPPQPPPNPPPGGGPPGGPGAPPGGGGGGGGAGPGGGGGAGGGPKPDPKPGEPQEADPKPGNTDYTVGGGSGTYIPTEPVTGPGTSSGTGKDPCPPKGGAGSSTTAGTDCCGDGTSVPGSTGPRTDGGETNTASQERDFTQPGVPCPNTTAGRQVTDGRRAGTVTAPGEDGARVIDMFGFPAVTINTDGSISLGGVEAARRPGGGPDGRDFPVGLEPTGNEVGGFEVTPSPGAVPRGAQERAEKRAREERRRKRREAKDKARQDAIDDLGDRADDYERRAEEEDRRRDPDRRLPGESPGSERKRDWYRAKANEFKRRRAKEQKRFDKAKERRQRREDYYERKRKQTEENNRKSRERSAEANRRRAERDRLRGTGRGATLVGAPTTEGGAVIPTVPGVGALAGNGVGANAVSIGATWGANNAANFRLPYPGHPGAPATVEGWAALATAAIRAAQDVIKGAFGGPEYLAANIAVVEENREGKSLAGSTIGQHSTTFPGETRTEPCGDQAALSVIRTTTTEAGGDTHVGGRGVLAVVRETRGEGAVTDNTPLILLENDRGNEGKATGDLVSTTRREFSVNADAGVTAQGVAVHAPNGSNGSLPSGNLFEVGRLPESQQGRSDARLTERYIWVEPDGTVYVRDSSGDPVAVDGNWSASGGSGGSGSNPLFGTGADGAVTITSGTNGTAAPYETTTFEQSGGTLTGYDDVGSVVMATTSATWSAGTWTGAGHGFLDTIDGGAAGGPDVNNANGTSGEGPLGFAFVTHGGGAGGGGGSFNSDATPTATTGGGGNTGQNANVVLKNSSPPNGREGGSGEADDADDADTTSTDSPMRSYLTGDADVVSMFGGLLMFVQGGGAGAGGGGGAGGGPDAGSGPAGAGGVAVAASGTTAGYGDPGTDGGDNSGSGVDAGGGGGGGGSGGVGPCNLIVYAASLVITGSPTWASAGEDGPDGGDGGDAVSEGGGDANGGGSGGGGGGAGGGLVLALYASLTGTIPTADVGGGALGSKGTVTDPATWSGSRGGYGGDGSPGEDGYQISREVAA
jgi:hypothetical protein